MTEAGERVNERNKARLVRDLAVLNKNLAKLGVEPLITTEAGEALQVDNLRKAVRSTGDYLVDVTHKLRGL
jgi:hypothetical protein